MPKNYSLKELNTWKVGGVCREFAAPVTISEAKAMLAPRLKNGERLYILGGGSNVLIQDGFLDAFVVGVGQLDRLSMADNGDGVELEVEAGFHVKKLLEFTIKNDLGGCEFLTGIPGTLGGALWGNAGASGAGFAGLVSEVETIEEDGSVRVWGASELNWKYRSSPFDGGKTVLVTKARLVTRRTEPKAIIEKIRFFSNLKKGQPIGKKTAGCVFKNPEGLSAGKLIDLSGCKGMRIGGAIVSKSHANFIENEKDAAARDIFELGERCRELVFELQGVRLEYEIRFFGEF